MKRKYLVGIILTLCFIMSVSCVSQKSLSNKDFDNNENILVNEVDSFSGTLDVTFKVIDAVEVSNE